MNRTDRLAQIRQSREADLPAHWELYASSDEAPQYAVYADPSLSWAVGFVGNQLRRAWRMSFHSEAFLREHLAWWTGTLAARRATRLATNRTRRLARKPRTLVVGDVLYCSWGYEQTQVYFYVVLELVGRESVRIQRIRSLHTPTNSMQGHDVPDTSQPFGPATVHRVADDGKSVAVRFGHAALAPRDASGSFSPLHSSSYH